MRKVLFFDVDGVLLEWFKPFIKYANSKGIPLRFEDIDGYNLELLPCWTAPGECYKMIGDFAKTHAWACLPLLTQPSNLHVLKNMGYELRVLSQVSNPLAQRIRTRYLSDVFGPVFSGVHYTTHKTTKLEFLVDFVEENEDTHVWLLDDKPQTIQDVTSFYSRREVCEHAGNIHAVAVNNRSDHPYLRESMDTVVIQCERGSVQYTPCVEAFVNGILEQEYPDGR